MKFAVQTERTELLASLSSIIRALVDARIAAEGPQAP